MAVKQWFFRHRSLIATATSGAVIVALIATVAIVSTGFTAQRLNLNDGSVWVANGSAHAIGRANPQVLQLNTVVASTGTDIEVIQRGSTVLLFDRSNGKVDIVDPATSKVLDSVPLPPQSPELMLAGDNVVVGSGVTGQFWITPLNQLAKFDAQSQPTLSFGGDSVASVTPAGVLFAYSADAREVYRVDAAHSQTVSQTVKAQLGNAKTKVAITSVGGNWALLDSASRTILTSSGTVKLSSKIPANSNPVLQQPSDAGDGILLSYSGGLLRVPIGGGTVATLVRGTGGNPAPPAVVGSCTYAAWSVGTAWRKCGPASPATLSLSNLPPAASALTFASNGDRVVLNDMNGGGAWAVQQHGELIDNWSDLITVQQNTQQVVENNNQTPPQFDKAELPPVAVDDTFGARPGRASVLPLLLNDYDPNGDPLVISAVTPIDAAIGHLDLINDNQQAQLTLTSAASGTFSFGYTISDGRGGTANARVTVQVRLPSQNSPPQQVRQSNAVVAAGGRVTTSVLGDWVDPDGDPIYLTSASTAPPSAVSFRPEGSVVFTDEGTAAGVRSVAVVVSDGKAQATGSLDVTVKPAGQVPIIADPFVKLAYSGQQLTIDPLTHVRGGTGTLRLVSVPGKTGATIVASIEAGTFTFQSDQIGTYYIDFVVNDGEQTANGVVRIDVSAPPNANTKPITIPKTVFVQTLGTQTIDVADTDYDPAGAVLLVTGVYNVPPTSGVRAEVIDEQSIRVSLTGPLESGPVSFNYRISNGLAEAEGSVTVVEISPTSLQPPIANDDSVTVRVGDAINIPVLTNDVQPDGGALTLDPQLTRNLSAGSGLLFASGNVLRYLAPNRTGDFTAVYSVSDSSGQKAQAEVKISVREPVQATNNPPVPVTVVARVLAGQTVRIPIPLTGIDPDGDSVQFLGQATNPTKGSVTAVGPDYLDFLAGHYSAGTDTFSYTVIDALGARAVGIIRVGISAKLDGARNPVAVPDEVAVRPGGTVSVQVLANDFNPDGGKLTITQVQPNAKNILASIQGDVVKVTPPRQTGRYGLVYTVQNEFGGASSAFITVVVRADAPLAYPVVSDTVLTLSDVLGRSTLDVNVLKNVFFADGDANKLDVSVLPSFSSQAHVTANKRVFVTVRNKSQIIPFAVTRPDDRNVVSYGFVWVPGLDDALPQLNRNAPALTVASESQLTINLNDYVLAIGGKQVRLTSASSVQATHSNGASLVSGDHILRFTSADKYFGPASISFEVTDGTSASDPNGRKATLVLPIQVTPRQNQPPLFVGGNIDFEPGTSRDIDLTKLTNYPYPKDVGELAYTVLTPLPTGFSYTLTGQTLSLRANENAPKNSTTSIVLGVKDSIATGQSGQIRLNVVASSRPLARPAPDSVVVPRGQSTTVDVLANDEATNPFPGKPLKVIAIRGLDGGSTPSGVSITPSADNQKLTVTVSSNAQPTDTNLQYEVADATGDPDRYVWGSVTVSVQDKPDPVTALSVSSFGDRKLTVRWSPGASNNSVITGYDILMTSVTGASLSTTSCNATVCDVSTPGNGPDNGVQLAVVAKNGMGQSDATKLSSTVWSDIIPAAPAGLGAVPLDGGLKISWTPVSVPSGGSPVNDYHLTAGSTSVEVNPSNCVNGMCSTSVLGLANGQATPVTVSARNSALATLASWNSSNTSATPAGKPLAIGIPTATATDSAIATSWAGAFAGNGRDITGYTAVAYTGAQPTCDTPEPPGATTQSVGTATSAAFSGLTSESSYSVVVLARNSIGCTPSSPVVARTSPGIVTAVTTSGPTQNGQTFDFELTGAAIGGTGLGSDYSFYYRLSGASVPATQYGPIAYGGLLTAEGQQYGQDISVQVRACRAVGNGGPVCQSQWSASFEVGTPVDPSVGPVSYAPATPGLTSPGTFTWPSWPSGTYEKIEYDCAGASNQAFLNADTTQGGSCQVPLGTVSPTLTIRVFANGGHSYDIRYDDAGDVQ
jgi:hypothetical protein